MSNQTPNNDVLTLHSSIGDRWQGNDSVGTSVGSRHDRVGLVDRTLDRLPGLASLQGSFGIDAWDLATILAVDSRFMAAGGLPVRAMSVAELADIVQIILEEEEDLSAEWAEYERLGKSSPAKTQRKVTKRVKKPAPGMAARVAAVRRAVAQARKAAATRRQQTRNARIAQARAHVETLRQQGADPIALAAAVIDLTRAESGSLESVTGDSVSGAPGVVETADPGLPTLRSMLSVARRDPAAIGIGQRMAETRAGSVAELQPSVAAGAIRWQQAGTRALRMADTAAELAMLQPAADAVWQSAPAEHAAAATAAPSLFAPRQISAHAHQRTGATAQMGSVAPAAQWRAEFAPATPATAQEAAALVQAQRLGQVRANAAQSTHYIPSLSSTPAAQTFATQRSAGLPAPAASGTSVRPMTPALQAASTLTSRQLTARIGALRAIAPRYIDAPPTAGSPTFATAAPKAAGPQTAQFTSTVGTAGRWIGGAAGPSIDPFSELFSAVQAPLTTGTERWLAATDVGTPTDVREGYFAHDLGGGEALQLGAPEVFDAADVRAAQPGANARAIAKRAIARSSTSPAWLTPAATPQVIAAVQAAQAQTAARSEALAAPVAQKAHPSIVGAPQFVQQLAAANRDVASPVAAQRAPTALSSTALPAGGMATEAVSLARSVSQRLMRGVEPTRVATEQGPTWRPMQQWRALTAAPSAAQAGQSADSSVAGAHRFMQQVAGTGVGMFARGDVSASESPWLAAAMVADTEGGTSFITPSRVAELRGAIAQMQGAGEWLLPGDAGFDTWREMAAAQQADRVSTPARAAARRAALSHAPVGVGQTARSPSSSATDALTPRAAASVAPAASAAIERFLSTQTRLSGKALGSFEMGAAATAFSTMSLATADDSVLGLSPADASDAMTPWLVARAVADLPATQARQFRFADDASIDMLALRPDADTALDGADTPVGEIRSASLAARRTPATVARTSAAAAATTTAWVTGQRARLERVLRQPALRDAVKRIGGGALDTATPAGLNAALALFGEADHGASDAELGDRFVKRFFGRVAKPSRRARVATPEMTSLRPTAITKALSAAGTDGATTAAPAGDRAIVFEGLSGLAALDMLNRGESTEALIKALGGTEQTLVQAGSEAADAAPSAPASAKAAKKVGRPATGVSTHRFTPVALKAGRSLLGRGRRSRSLLTRSPQSARGFRQRAGYGAASLGGGGLVGLQPGDAGPSFHGGYTDARTSRRAERLSTAVMSRRGTRPGQLGRSLASSDAPAHVRSSRQAGSLPRDFAFDSERALVDNKAAEPRVIERTRVVHVQSPNTMRYDPRKPASQGTRAAVQSAASSSFGAAAPKSSAAASMARVLSVTAAPTANILPLVAPAARAVASAAAAKGLSEGVQMATSGANPSMIAPMSGHDIQGQTSGGPGQGSTEKERAESGGTPAQELDQLAMKIARSVMVRIKRERERRGIYG